MNKNLKIGLSLLIVASTFFLCSTLAFFVLKESEREKRLYLEKRLEEIINEKESLANSLDEIKIINKELESKLGSARQEARRISEELAREKEVKKIAESQLKEEKKKTDSLMADVMKEKEERLDLVHKLSKAEESYSKLKEEFELMIEAKETLEEKLKDMMAKKGVELEKIEVKTGYDPDEYIAEEVQEVQASQEWSAPSKRRGDVLVVNKKFNFIVCNIGKRDEAEMGTELDVYRKDQLIAKTKIEKLYDRMSAATILPEWINAKIREGDKILISN